MVRMSRVSAVLLAGWFVTPAFGQLSRLKPQPAPPPNNVYVAPQVGVPGAISAQGKYMTDTQQAKLMQEQVKQSKTDTQRKAFDEWQYEQANTPTQEQKRTKAQQEELKRSRNDPPLTEIWSAKALNDLLKDLQRLQGTSAYARTVLLDQATLKRVNVTTGKTGGGIGLLRDADKLRWPLALQDPVFDAERKQIDKLMPAAAKQAKQGAVQASTLRDLIDAVKKADNKLRGRVGETPSNQYIDGKRFLDELEEVTRVLQEPRVASYFDQWQAKGSSVSELVTHMTKQGLRFAPVTAGDEAYYTSLHRAMANYDTALNQQVAKR